MSEVRMARGDGRNEHASILAVRGRLCRLIASRVDAGTTPMRKSEILSIRRERVHFGDAPVMTLVRTKTGPLRHVLIPQSIVKTLKALRSFGTREEAKNAQRDRS